VSIGIIKIKYLCTGLDVDKIAIKIRIVTINFKTILSVFPFFDISNNFNNNINNKEYEIVKIIYSFI
jgi:hypothetical protein